MMRLTENAGIQPVLRTSAPLATLDVTDTASEVDFRLGQIRMANTFHDFVKGHDYLGKITAKLEAPMVIVNVNGHQIQMAMDKELPLGEHIQLRFMGASPNPSFLLLNSLQQATTGETKLSDAAQNIVQYLRFANSPSLMQAESALRAQQAQSVTTAPLTQPSIIAQEIKQLVSLSGVFYESHLAAHAQGQRSINSILQEPQNTHPHQIAHIVPQQLQVLETNRFEWQGAIWQNQIMHMSIERLPIEHQAQDDAKQRDSGIEEIAHFESKLHLDLPNLGSIHAKLRLIDGQLQLSISAEQASSALTMRQESHDLIQAFETSDTQSIKLAALNIEQNHANPSA